MSDTTMYTQGNWKVSRQTTDTQETGKLTRSLAVPVFHFGSDFALKSDEPKEAVIINKTADGIDPKESIRFGYTDVDNIYNRVNGLKVPTAERAAVASGVQTLVEVKHLYHAVNTVNGQEITLPALARITVVVPTHCAVTNDLLTDIVSRGISGLFNSNQNGAVTSANRVLECAKGQLKPADLG